MPLCCCFFSRILASLLFHDSMFGGQDASHGKASKRFPPSLNNLEVPFWWNSKKKGDGEWRERHHLKVKNVNLTVMCCVCNWSVQIFTLNVSTDANVRHSFTEIRSLWWGNLQMQRFPPERQFCWEMIPSLNHFPTPPSTLSPAPLCQLSVSHILPLSQPPSATPVAVISAGSPSSLPRMLLQNISSSLPRLIFCYLPIVWFSMCLEAVCHLLQFGETSRAESDITGLHCALFSCSKFTGLVDSEIGLCAFYWVCVYRSLFLKGKCVIKQ